MAVELDKHEWYGQNLEAKSGPLFDEGVGGVKFIRQFYFKFQKGLKALPSKQALFNEAWPLIRPLIWSDGLVASTDVDPRVVIDGKKGYRIFLLCEPKFRSMVVDKTKTLQELFNKKVK